jgi:hypothetical protein
MKTSKTQRLLTVVCLLLLLTLFTSDGQAALTWTPKTQELEWEWQAPRLNNAPSNYEWTVMDSGTTETLYGVWCSDARSVFVVGNSGTILHYDGNEWRAMNSGTSVLLYGVWGTDSNNVFAVGNNGTILHYDGNEWHQMHSGTTIGLGAIWGSAPNDVFAVGGDGIILHYDGNEWHQMHSGTTTGLGAIWGSAPNDVFAVGGDGIILHYDGNNWSEVYRSTFEFLGGIWGNSSNDVFAVGWQIILHYDGNIWTEMKIEHYVFLNEVWSSDDEDDVYVAGDSTWGRNPILHYDGSTWSEVHNGTTSLRGIGGSGPNDVFAVGKNGTILHYAGKHYSISGHVRDTTDAPLSNVTVSAGSDFTTVTNVDGAYTLPDLSAGTYTLTADKPSWAFDPPTRTVVLDSDVTGQDFAGIDVSAVISQVEYLADDTETRLNQLLNESRDIAEDGDYFAIAKKEDQVELIADAIVGGAGVLAEGVDTVADTQDLMKMNFPGVTGRGWGHIIDLRNSNEVARDAFREAMLQPVTGANAGRAAKELFNGAHLYYAADIADTAADDFLSDVLVKYNWQMGLRSDLALQNELYPANEALVSVYVQNLGTTTYRTMDNVPFMTPDVQAMYIEDLTKRSQSNIIIASTLENRARPLHLARDDRETEEDAWLEEFLVKYLLKQLIYLWGDGPAAFATEALEWGYELYQNHQRLKEDMRMMHLAVEGMSGAATSENRVYLNTVHGMDNIVQGIEPQIARGSIRSLTHISEGEYKFFGSWWWCEHTAYSEVDISNLSSYATVYQGIADYKSTGILGWNYELLVSEGVKSIPGGDSDLLRIYYKRDDQGVSPDEVQTYPVATEASAINVTLLGSTDTGTYYVTNVGNTWVPIRVETSGAVRASLENHQTATTIPYPIRTRLTAQDDNLIYYSYIWVDNPFTQTVNITLTQALPADVEIVSSDAVSTSEDALVWHQALEPQTTVEITHTFRYQGAAGRTVEYPEPQLTMTNISATTQLTFTGETESFTSLPPLTGESIPPAQVTKGEIVSVPITLTNRLTTETVSGTVQLELIDFIAETHIYSDTRSVSLVGGAEQSISFTFQTSDITPRNYLLAASVTSNGGKEEIFEEYFAVRPLKIYLPLVLKTS